MFRTARLLAASVLLAVFGFAGAAEAKQRDRDGDRLPDRWEQRYKLSTKAKSAGKDNDRDGLTNLGEYRSKTDPRDADSDDDGTEDADEDRDSDDVDNADEMRAGTDPRERDSDDDGTEDGDEDADEDGMSNAAESRSGYDLSDKDSDNDGTEDGDEISGVVDSFSGGTLTIRLADGSTISGAVTDATEIECDDYDEGSDDRVARAADEGENDQDEDETSCSQADLTAGSLVHEAELVAGVFEEIELVK